MRTPWLINSKPNRRASVRLFCFPYAGGGDSIFHSWQQSLPDTIEVCPVQLPGRNSRITEPPCKEMNQLIRLAGQALAPYLDKPFALFGHSMGALISFEIARYTRREYNAQPVHLFASGHSSPQTRNDPIDLKLSDSVLPEMILRHNGTHNHIREDGCHVLWVIVIGSAPVTKTSLRRALPGSGHREPGSATGRRQTRYKNADRHCNGVGSGGALAALCGRFPRRCADAGDQRTGAVCR